MMKDLFIVYHSIAVIYCLFLFLYLGIQELFDCCDYEFDSHPISLN